uniref:excinuclease ATPase subunit n=1 Tax=Halomonas sp. TaxID=1486246 RepID=UPI002618C86A|nr:excinuclease ATPase subunit [Halomonas sp.]
MKKGLICLALMLSSMVLASMAQARDTQYFLPIQDVLAMPEAKKKLDPNIHFVFGDSAVAGSVAQEHGPVVTYRKTNALNKTDEEACRWVMLSALLAIQERAKEEGANAVINITSYYDEIARPSATEYECRAGTLIAGVSLKGEVVTLE